MNGIGCANCCAIPPGPGPECMCECHDGPWPYDPKPSIDKSVAELVSGDPGVTTEAFRHLA